MSKPSSRRPQLAIFAAFGLTLGLSSPLLAEQWVEVRTPSVQVISNASAKQARKVALEFEEIRTAIESFFPTLEHSTQVLPVIALKSGRDGQRLLGRNLENVGGYFVPDPHGAVVVLRLDVDTQFSYGILYHEYFHTVTRHSLPGLPLWLNEGLAEVWSNSLIDKRGFQLGLPAKNHLRYLGTIKMRDLEGIVEPDRAAAAYADRNQKPNLYAQGWALTHYMMFSDGGSRWPKLLRYLEAAASGQDERSAWNAHFPPREQVTRDLWSYLKSGRLSYKMLKREPGETALKPEVQKLTDAEFSALHGYFLVRSGLGEREGTRELLLAGTKGARAAQAYEGLGLLELSEDNPQAAHEAFKTAIEKDPAAPLAHYLLATTEIQLKTEGWQQRYIDHLGTASSLADWFGLPAMQAARYFLNSGDIDTAIALGRGAVERIRGSADAHLTLAAALKEKAGGLEEARRSVRFALHLATNAQGAFALNQVCWYGSLHGFVKDVAPGCERAVKRAPSVAAFRDSRGLARALLGDFEGAKEDFEVVVAAESLDAKTRLKRSEWVTALGEGTNPITEEELAELLLEEDA